jgi:hypothetical protein
MVGSVLRERNVVDGEDGEEAVEGKEMTASGSFRPSALGPGSDEGVRACGSLQNPEGHVSGAPSPTRISPAYITTQSSLSRIFYRGAYHYILSKTYRDQTNLGLIALSIPRSRKTLMML